MRAVSEPLRLRLVLPCAALALLAVAGCASTAPSRAPLPPGERAVLYLARRSWHVDVGLAAADLQPALAPLGRQFSAAKYLFFGFGDRHYLLAGAHRTPGMVRALLPGPAVILVTAVGDPGGAFGPARVIELTVSRAQARALQDFIRASLSQSPANPLAPGPYADSAYYAAGPRYSALHTCNTWVAEALRAAGQPVRVRGVVLAGQLWSQARRLGRSRAQLQGG